MDPDFRLTVFVNEALPELVICSLRLILPASSSHFRENLIAKFLPARIFRCLSETASKARQALVSLALFSFFFFSLKKAPARFSKCASRSRDPGPGTRC